MFLIARSKKGPLDIYISDIHKNKCRIITWLNSKSGTFYIKDVCTHTEYDKWWRKQTKSKRSKR
ncbi:type II toxin-antitoxin system HigB family toxin [Xenorhabdus taiwanensis]|uniref:type II toxin-antitoxin system HigB family toxin n=1 Tax=Xenorhabdus taiwanensis TaxID=3085177 RepID=UPI0035A6D7B8